ncbi:hypothetical protein PGT21_011261 [Puccinia graminis f. sp. tritici]|uniref:Uncharacterized protein n=1 Tax=Puccinia graminis f. sp. tritici TaxID=56615 RepID=A0A5B0MR71_PUCGR|nr:hypothetical protein PGT21_011261 [Puccinia graminis f. sp. tritici]
MFLSEANSHYTIVKLSEEERGSTRGTCQKYSRYSPGGAKCGTWYLFSEKIQQLPKYKQTIST